MSESKLKAKGLAYDPKRDIEAMDALPADNEMRVVHEGGIANEPLDHGEIQLSKGDVFFMITEKQFQQLGSYVGCNLKDVPDLLNHVEAMTHIRVNDVSVKLSPGLLHRLQSRCIRQDFNKFLGAKVVELLHGYVGW